MADAVETHPSAAAAAGVVVSELPRPVERVVHMMVDLAVPGTQV